MKFSMCIGGLKYNVDCLTEQFYEKYGRKYECPYSKDGFDLSVTENELISFEYYDEKLETFKNEATYFLGCAIKHCLDYNRMIIHGAAIRYNGNGILFIAPSGTGKTTHIGLWKKYLDGVEIINGDKPMLIFDNGITVCGTPWNGKEYLGENIFAPLKAIVVLKQGKVNSFKKMNVNDSVVALLKQCFYSVSREYGHKVLGYMSKIAGSIPIFSLECDISEEAFKTCYEGLRNYID